MKKVICTVGMSLFSNYFNMQSDGAQFMFNEEVKDRPYTDWDEWKQYLEPLKSRVLDVSKDQDALSAEVHSIKILHRKIKEPLDVHLLATDTLGSVLAAEIIHDILIDNDEINVFFNPQIDVIRGLQVQDDKLFKQRGLMNLIDRIDNLTNSYPSERLFFNITGGYKAIIPYMTIMAQIKRAEIIYKFEETDALIHIPKLPITIDESVFEKYATELQLLDDVIVDYHKIKDENYVVYSDLEQMGLIETLDGGAGLSPIGRIFWQKYKKNCFVFYCPDDVYQEILSQKDVQRVIREKISNQELRKRKTERKKDHYTFDDGNNDNRIFYFEHADCVYIYKTFESEEKAREFIDTEFNKEHREQIIKISKPRIWRIEKNV